MGLRHCAACEPALMLEHHKQDPLTQPSGFAVKPSALVRLCRVVGVSPAERSYHIFYMLCQGGSDDLCKKLKCVEYVSLKVEFASTSLKDWRPLAASCSKALVAGITGFTSC